MKIKKFLTVIYIFFCSLPLILALTYKTTVLTVSINYQTDLNGDGITDPLDLKIFMRKYGYVYKTISGTCDLDKAIKDCGYPVDHDDLVILLNNLQINNKKGLLLWPQKTQ